MIRTGVLNSMTDADNNITTSYTYDTVGRQLTANEAGYAPHSNNLR